MAVIRVKAIGRGVPEDPFRAPLPTYTELFTDYDNMTVLVQIPDADLHDAPEKLDSKARRTSKGHLITQLDAAQHKAWHAHLDDRYQERSGEFKPEVV